MIVVKDAVIVLSKCDIATNRGTVLLYICVSVSFVSVVCNRFMCAATIVAVQLVCYLCVDYNVNVLMSVKYRNRMYHCVLRPKKIATEDVHCVNCDNVSEVL